MRILAGLLLVCLTALGDVRLPPYKRQVLDNGAVVYTMQRQDVPLVTIRAVVKGGIESDPAGLAGLAAITAEMLRRGTSTRSAEQFAREIDSLGATLEINVDEQSTELELECLAKDFRAGLNLLTDAIRRPAFAEAEFKKLIAQRIDGLKSIKDNPQAAGSRYWRAFYYGSGHPYGRVSSAETLARIALKDVVSYHQGLFAGQNLIVAAVGSVDPAKAAAEIEAAFGDVPKGTAYQWKSVPPVRPDQARAALVTKADATQTVFYIGEQGIPRNHPDRIPLWIVNTLFGGRFTSMLMEELRVNSGLTYGVYSHVEQNHLPGRISVSAATPTESTAKAVDMSLEVMRRLINQGINATQLQSAKAYIKGTYPSERLETPDQLAQILTEIELNDLSRGEVDDLFSRIDAVTLEQANAIAKKYFDGANLTFLFVGNPSVKPQVTKYAPELVEAAITRPGFSLP